MATPILARKTLLFSKSETTEGTDSNPSSAGSNALLISNVTLSIDGEDIEREILLDTLSRLGSTPGLRTGRVTFNTEMRGMGAVPTAATPLREDSLFQAVQIKPTYAAGTATYKPTSVGSISNSPTTSLHILLGLTDGTALILKLKGCRGNWGFDAQNGRYGVYNWNFQGRFDPIPSGATSGDIADVSTPTAPSFQALTTVPPTVHGATLTVHNASTLVLRQVTFDLQNDVQRRENQLQGSGIESLLIVSRNPIGSIDPEATARAFFDPFRIWELGTQAAVNYQVGSTSGNRVLFNGPKVQLGIPAWEERNGIRVLRIPTRYGLDVSTGDDEFSLIYT